MTQKIYDRLRNTIDEFNQNWRNGVLSQLKTKLPQLGIKNKLCEISEVSLKDGEVYVRFFTGLYTRWKKVEATDEIVFNDVNYKIM